MAKILYIESEPDHVALLKYALSGHDIVAVENATQAVNLVNRNGLDLIIAEPGPDPTAARNLALLAKKGNKPFMVLSSRRYQGIGDLCLPKPYDPLSLREEVENLLTKNGSAGPAADGSREDNSPA